MTDALHPGGVTRPTLQSRTDAIPRNELEITYVSIESVREYESHARVHSRKAIAKAKLLLSAYGEIVPIVIDDAGVIVDGHLRYCALRELGRDQILVTVAANRDPATVKALRLALNRLPQDATWDDERLRAEFAALVAMDYDLDLTGFETPQIDMVLSVDELPSNAFETESDEVISPVVDPVVRTGDCYQLGRHTIACADARDDAALAALFGPVQANAAIIDPPYNVRISGNVSGTGKHREFAMASGEMSSDEFSTFLTTSLHALTRTLASGATAFVFMDWRHIGELIKAAKSVGLTVLNLCVWVKTNPGMGNFYRSAHELCLVCRFGDVPHINNFELGQHGRSRSNVWHYAGMSSFGKDRDTLLSAHPTVKPQPLLIDIVKDVTKRGMVVVDTFLGSGSTLLACEETGRTCVGVEIDSAYVEVAIRRWQRRTGKDAVHATTGETFDALCERAVRAKAEAKAGSAATDVDSGATTSASANASLPDEAAHG